MLPQVQIQVLRPHAEKKIIGVTASKVKLTTTINFSRKDDLKVRLLDPPRIGAVSENEVLIKERSDTEVELASSSNSEIRVIEANVPPASDRTEQDPKTFDPYGQLAISAPSSRIQSERSGVRKELSHGFTFVNSNQKSVNGSVKVNDTEPDQLDNIDEGQLRKKMSALLLARKVKSEVEEMLLEDRGQTMPTTPYSTNYKSFYSMN